MRGYVFILKNGTVLRIVANNIKEAMDEIENTWYKGILEAGFEVLHIDGSSTAQSSNHLCGQ